MTGKCTLVGYLGPANSIFSDVKDITADLKVRLWDKATFGTDNFVVGYNIHYGGHSKFTTGTSLDTPRLYCGQ